MLSGVGGGGVDHQQTGTQCITSFQMLTINCYTATSDEALGSAVTVFIFQIGWPKKSVSVRFWLTEQHWRTLVVLRKSDSGHN